MKHFLLLAVLVAVSITSAAQSQDADSSSSFRAYLENKEFDVYMRINFYDNDVRVPGQDYYGEVPGFLGKTNNPFCWIVVDAQVKSEKEAELSLVNDYGSEDLVATLVRQNDSTYVLRQGAGSAIKIPRDRKWFKLPNNIEFKRQVRPSLTH